MKVFRNKVIKIHNAEEQKSKKTCGEENEKSDDRDETDLEHREKII